MSEIPAPPFEQILAQCQGQLELLAESFNITCEQQYTLSAGDSPALADVLKLPETDQPGLLVSIEVDGGVLLAAIPETLPLPAWYTQPDMEQKSRLGTLAMEWSMNCLPPDMAANGFATEAVLNLRAAMIGCQPAPEGLGLCVLGSRSGADPVPVFWLAGPFARGPGAIAAPAPVSSSPPAPVASPPPAAAAPRPAPPARAPKGPGPLHRLLNIRVKLIVQLAEKKIEMSQLMALGPGAIVTFEKSCEDLLELYVNNQLYCRGEAVKIGEKFGLKISEVGAQRQKHSNVLGLAR